ncbi:MAG: T9SS type A sorting domain-containing protein [Bacteroidia bacterium]|nr:T9SS type A sorting domain-containing protein [Bacteroidia bacterium]
MIMKKTLLFIAATMFTFSLSAQRTWVVGDDATNFPVSAGIGAGPDKSVFVADLGIHTGTATNTNMGQVEASSKSFGDITYPNRFKMNGAGYPSAADTQTTPAVGETTYYTPTQRFLTIKVTGAGTIKIQGVTGSSSSTRRLFVTNGTSLVGTMVFEAGSAISEQTVEYTGGEAVLYIFGNQSINLYRIEATSATTHTSLTSSVNNIFTDKGIRFDGVKLTNESNLSLRVYNTLGKEVARANSEINMSTLPKGVYMVRAEGVKGAFKFSK